MASLAVRRLVMPGLLLAGALAPLAQAMAASSGIAIPVLNVTANGDGGQTYTLSLQLLLVMTALTLLPAALMMLSSFTRIVIVLSLLRQAIGTAQTPSNQVLIGISLFLTLFIMGPVIDRIYTDAVQPYLNEQLPLPQALEKGKQPLMEFMRDHTRQTDLAAFVEMSRTPPGLEAEQIPFSVLAPAFVTSELKTAFQMGFLMFIPFLIIDLVVASVLMSMGMMMLSPVIISFPFKLMLFVLVDGWSLVMGTMASSFYL